MVIKAKGTLWLIKRILGFKAPEGLKCQLSYSLVRSKLEYCTRVWGGLIVLNTYTIERMQVSATRYIPNFPDFHINNV